MGYAPRFIEGYRNDDAYRLSFNGLAQSVFGIDFERWYQAGFWDDRYVCHSFVDGDEVVANVSTYQLDLVLEGRPTSAVQVGTVMTHPKYRRRGLSRRLLNHVLAGAEQSGSLVFLFGHRGVANFYPRMGFTAVEQVQFESAVDVYPSRSGAARRLDPHCDEDVQLLYHLASSRRPVSQVCGVENTEGILVWYFFDRFRHDFYYVRDQNVVLVCRQEQDTLRLHDVISKDRVELVRVLPHVTEQPVSRVVYGFTPDLMNITVQMYPKKEDDFLFATANTFGIHSPFRYPVTAQT